MTLEIPRLQGVDEILRVEPRSSGGAIEAIEAVGPWGSGKALVASQVAMARGASLLYITSGRIEAEAAFEDLCTYSDPDRCVLFPAWEVLPTDAMKPSVDIVAERLYGLNRLLVSSETKEPVFVAASIRSVLQRVLNRDHLNADTVTLRVGEEHDLTKVVRRLSELGYERELMVEARGHMSVRGGLFDVFPISAELPYRVEFLGDEIESIRRFEPETQRSVDSVEEIHILPPSEKRLLSQQAESGGTLSSLMDYMGPHTLVVLDEPIGVREEAERLDAQFSGNPYMIPWEETQRHFEAFPRISIAQMAHDAAPDATRVNVPMNAISGWAGQADGFWDQLKRWDLDGYAVQLLCTNSGERRRLLELLTEQGYQPGEGNFDLRVELGRLRAGFTSPADRFAILSEREIFGRKYVSRKRRRFEAGAAVTAFSDLRAADYVVHQEHGIGRYLGLKRFPGKASDFLAIQYHGNDVIYVPVTHVDQIQKYIGGGGAIPKMDKLGGGTWVRTKSKVKKSVQDMAEELIKLYAARERSEGHAFPPDTHWQDEFEDSFEYDETPDQLTAIAAIKQDMEMAKPMDRLLCGDVGYGKTEVALRAAFKAVMERKQVAMLVPTTVLAEQHYRTFCDRLADYPVRVEMLSRFRTAKENRETIQRMRAGEVDIVIGTHRLTSGDVQFKDLGLVILDEEQRFGVKHKEKLKKLKVNVDVLTMTATPIPRTLHLSMSGIRDMSMISTAPNDRLPIHTCIEAFDEALIAEAIERELGREGQVFYLHNRVQTIDRVAAMIRKLVPRARVAIGHGQMHEHELEETMARFIRGETDVLVCTTIIGSGLDIPNANTIIVDRADQFGLAELYQLRGRVGRYKHRAFAYLLIPGDRALTEEAQRRLKALEEFSTLGSGFRIAMRDLEIRGCGNILGGEQSGHIAAVGYETYTQLIAEAVAELKGEPAKRVSLPPFDATVEVMIPEEYIPVESQKITLYKRISGLQSIEELEEMYDELRDRFGEPPPPVKRLLEVMRVRVLGGETGVAGMSAAKGMLTLRFESIRFIDDDARQALTETFGKRIHLTPKGEPLIAYRLDDTEDVVAAARRILDTMSEEHALA